ncbi:MAG: hypothetical protein KBT11_02950 [Treponema sp.]|nr:hypothetical protein [Candidatus Treponema equifaecale]
MRKFFILILTALTAVFSAPAQSSPKGYELSKSISSILTANSFSSETQILTPTGQDKFSENFILNFPAEATEFSDSQRYNVIFDITQEDFYENQSSVLEFLNYLKNKKLSFNAHVLFSASTASEIADFPKVSGSAVYAEQLDNNDNYCAVTIDFTTEKKNTIYTATLNSTTPLWLCKRAAESFLYTNEDFDFPNLISSVYRLGIVRGQMRMYEYTKNEIPAVSMNFQQAEKLQALKKFLELYTPEGTEEWDQHYFFIPAKAPLRPIFLNERFCMLACMILGIISLFLLCTFTFTGKRGEQNKYELLKNLYVIPLTLFFSVAGLVAAQGILKTFSGNDFSEIFSGNPVMQFGFKIIFSIFLISLIFALHNFMKIPTENFIYGYIISFVALFNIFLFCTKDLMLFIPFVGEYLLIYLTRRWKKLWLLILIFVLMAAPFMPYAIVILRHGEIQDVSRWIFTGFLGNLSMALALFPFQLLWLKILVHLELYNKNKGAGLKKIIFNGTISTISILCFVLGVMLLLSNFIYKPAKRLIEDNRIQIFEENQQTLNLKVLHNEFYGMNTNHIKLSSKENAVQYSVSIFGKDKQNPVYDSLYDYELRTEIDEKSSEENEVASFVIPENPPKSITIDYAADSKAKAKIVVSAIYRTDEKNVFRRETVSADIGTKK